MPRQHALDQTRNIRPPLNQKYRAKPHDIRTPVERIGHRQRKVPVHVPEPALGQRQIGYVDLRYGSRPGGRHECNRAIEHIAARRSITIATQDRRFNAVAKSFRALCSPTLITHRG